MSFGVAALSSGCRPAGDEIDASVSHNHHYGFLKRSVIWSRGGNCLGPGCTTISGADPKTFRPLNPSYAVDEERVYFEANVIEGEPPAGFAAVGPYGLGERRVYWNGREIVDADRASFVVEPFGKGENRQFYGRDARRVYCRDRVISSAPASFHALERPRYFADERDVYIIDGGVCRALDADPVTFVFLKAADGAPSTYARDVMSVYSTLGGTVIPEADPASFRVRCVVASRSWAVDAKHVFEGGRLVPGALPETFAFPPSCPTE